MNSKKLKTGIISLMCVVAVAVIIFAVKSNSVTNVERIASDAVQVEVYDFWGTETVYTLTEEEKTDFLNTLKNLTVGAEFTTEEVYYGSRTKEYLITLSNGEEITLSASGPELCVDVKRYECDNETLNKLSFYFSKYCNAKTND